MDTFATADRYNATRWGVRIHQGVVADPGVMRGVSEWVDSMTSLNATRAEAQEHAEAFNALMA